MADDRRSSLEALGSADGASFEHAVRALAAAGPQNDAGVASLVLDAARALGATSGVSARERDRRLRVVALTLAPSEGAFRIVAAGAGTVPPESLNALRAVLPPDMRTLAVSRAPAAGGPAATRDAATTGKPAAPAGGAAGTAPVGPPGPPPPSPPSAERDADVDAHAQYAVALVGVAAEHDNNRSLLAAAGLKPLPVRVLEELWDLAPTGLCGFVVGPSVWTAMTADRQRDALTRACALSTVLFARVAVDGLAADVAAGLPQTAAGVRCGPVDGSRFCHGDGCQLTPADVDTLRRIAYLLATAERTSFFPLGLPDADARLLRLISAMRGAGPLPSDAVRNLGARELAGGRSGARLYVLRPAGENRPMVIKLDDVAKLRDEVSRYRRWIQPWETTVTDAQLHSHLGSSAISYHLQSDPDALDVPAPTLEDRLLLLRHAETWRDDGRIALEADLTTALGRAVDHLAALSARNAADATGDQFWFHWPAENLKALGVVNTVTPEGRGPVTVADVVGAAARRVERLHNRAVTHGDVHSRNLLLVDRTPVFVDFAKSGPGHPAYDLACLDAAVRVHAMRLGVGEGELGLAYRDLYVRGRAEGDLRDSCPAALSSATSRVAIATACRARAAGLRVLKSYGGGPEDYLAMVAAVSGFVLTHLAPQSGVERAVLAAVADAVV